MAGLDNASASISRSRSDAGRRGCRQRRLQRRQRISRRLAEGFDSLSGRIAPPIADPFVTMLAKTAEGYTLSGVLPDETARAVILDAVGDAATDTSTVARGGPDGVAVGDVFSSVAAIFDAMIEGTATMTANTLAVVGTASSFSGASEAETGLQALATDALSVEVDIAPGPATPFRFSAQTSDESLSLQGFAPTDDARDTILSSASELFPGYAVTDDLVIAEGAPEGFLAMVQAGLRGLSRLANGSFETSDTNATLSGGRFTKAWETVSPNWSLRQRLPRSILPPTLGSRRRRQPSMQKPVRRGSAPCFQAIRSALKPVAPR
jgi:OOP family OmpA-OmpF porin